MSSQTRDNGLDQDGTVEGVRSVHYLEINL